MPAYPATSMVNAILEAITDSGYIATFLSDDVRGNPKIFGVSGNGLEFTVAVYIWTLTHGGRQSLPDEFRIQMTGVQPPLPRNSTNVTVLMGYLPELNVFSGFDIDAHSHFTPGSPSVQIDIAVLNNALQNGLAFGTKDNSEIAIGIRPDQIVFYMLNSVSLHMHGMVSPGIISDLNGSSSHAYVPQQIINASNMGNEQARTLITINRVTRNARFARAVLNAYEHRCAITRMQLKLVDAAHILPVVAQGSLDTVQNGIALSPTFHRAFDNRLIYFDENYTIKLNNDVYGELLSQSLADGFHLIQSHLERTIHLPHDFTQRPHPDFIRQANIFRRIPGY